jgi:hypothetical protein
MVDGRFLCTLAALALSCFVSLAGCAIISQLAISAFDISTLLLLGIVMGLTIGVAAAVGIIRRCARKQFSIVVLVFGLAVIVLTASILELANIGVDFAMWRIEAAWADDAHAEDVAAYQELFSCCGWDEFPTDQFDCPEAANESCRATIYGQAKLIFGHLVGGGLLATALFLFAGGVVAYLRHRADVGKNPAFAKMSELDTGPDGQAGRPPIVF